MTRRVGFLLLSSSALLLAGCGRHDEATRYNGYAEAEYTRVAAPVAGRLVSLAVQRGGQVHAGAPLFALEQVDQAAALQQAQAEQQRAEAQARDLAQGQRPDEVAAAEAALQQAEADQRDAAREWQRQRDLARQGFLSTASLDAAKARRDAADARVRELQAQLRTTRLGARAGQQAAARAEAKAAAAAVAQSAWRLSQTAVSAPVAARVDDTLYRVGEWVTAGAPVVSLLEPGAIKLRFFVPEGELARVPVGAHVQVQCDGCGAPIAATVRYVASQAEFTPPVIYSESNRSKLVYLVEAWPAPADAMRLHPGQPVDITPVAAAAGAAAAR
jgi:HlyD family secretion protein